MRLRHASARPHDARKALRRIKLLHTLVWAFFASCIVAIPVAAAAGAIPLALGLAAVVGIEVAVLLLNGFKCPLTGVAARYTPDRQDNFDIYLPLWLARPRPEPRERLVLGKTFARAVNRKSSAFPAVALAGDTWSCLAPGRQSGSAMYIRNCVNAAIVVACVALAGCATSRSEIKLGSPETPASAAVSPSRVAVIRSIRDERVFEQAPRDPSTPSLGFGGADNATADLRARAIGRKRNTFGKALGDVLLEDNQTVEGVIRDNLAAALRQAGFQVEAGSAAGAAALVIDVRIKQFWSWFQPGFWAIKLHANIVTDLDVSGSAAPTIIQVHAEDSRQLATEGAWMEIVDKALDDYRTQVAGKAAAFPRP